MNANVCDKNLKWMPSIWRLLFSSSWDKNRWIFLYSVFAPNWNWTVFFIGYFRLYFIAHNQLLDNENAIWHYDEEIHITCTWKRVARRHRAPKIKKKWMNMRKHGPVSVVYDRYMHCRRRTFTWFVALLVDSKKNKHTIGRANKEKQLWKRVKSRLK